MSRAVPTHFSQHSIDTATARDINRKTKVGGLGAALRPPAGPGQSPGGGEAPGSSWILSRPGLELTIYETFETHALAYQ
uniref:Uncharacterized protein n=1 Tax=Magallana gigas TaxID=29159 RepID=K1S656_MAGGI